MPRFVQVRCAGSKTCVVPSKSPNAEEPPAMTSVPSPVSAAEGPPSKNGENGAGVVRSRQRLKNALVDKDLTRRHQRGDMSGHRGGRWRGGRPCPARCIV